MAQAQPAEPPIAPPVSDVVFGDLYGIFTDPEGDSLLTLFVAMEPEPMPESEPVGHVEVHAGHWTMRTIREVPTTYETVSVIDRNDVCQARVTRTRVLHAHLETADPESESEWTFLGLELEGCRNGSMAVAGAPVRVHRCGRNELDTPATEALARLVQAEDDDLMWEDPLPLSAYRMIDFPGHRVTVVVGSGAWVVRDGVVLHERYHGIPRTVVEAGDRLLFQMSAPSEDWAAALEHFAPR